MGDKDKSRSNIISMCEHPVVRSGRAEKEIQAADVSEFIVDMLDTLVKISSKKERTLLTYLLTMARDEALEMKRQEEEPKKPV